MKLGQRTNGLSVFILKQDKINIHKKHEESKTTVQKTLSHEQCQTSQWFISLACMMERFNHQNTISSCSLQKHAERERESYMVLHLFFSKTQSGSTLAVAKRHKKLSKKVNPSIRSPSSELWTGKIQVLCHVLHWICHASIEADISFESRFACAFVSTTF